ncbi:MULTISPECIES: hypothetical protein [Streptomyces]|uniref:Uncharacterized protein n=1 Tax=Streptomyces cremeus TaxID=66881 RepID=A0ABV5PCZ1_STRCM
MTQTEDRLRAALAARADQLTYSMLRRGEVPQGRTWGVRRVRGIAYAVVGAAAVVAVCLLVLLPHSPVNPTPVPPAQPPRVVDTPRPTTTPALPESAPAVSREP